MNDSSFIHQHLPEVENALATRKRQRSHLDREITALEEIIRVGREFVYRTEGDSATLDDHDHPRTWNAPGYGGKRRRNQKEIKEMLTEHGTLHRTQIAQRLEDLGLV